MFPLSPALRRLVGRPRVALLAGLRPVAAGVLCGLLIVPPAFAVPPIRISQNGPDGGDGGFAIGAGGTPSDGGGVSFAMEFDSRIPPRATTWAAFWSCRIGSSRGGERRRSRSVAGSRRAGGFGSASAAAAEAPHQRLEQLLFRLEPVVAVPRLRAANLDAQVGNHLIQYARQKLPLLLADLELHA
jgi:hypothetical protein